MLAVIATRRCARRDCSCETSISDHGIGSSGLGQTRLVPAKDGNRKNILCRA